MRRFLLVFLFIFFGLIVLSYFWLQPFPLQKKHYVVAGTSNPGTIEVYENDKGTLKKVKLLGTGYDFVYTVRLGDIKNDTTRHIIAGVSNSFFSEPYGCRVVEYEMKTYTERLIDDVGDLRCKDLTIGDVDNDGKNEIVLGTHGVGLIRIYKWEHNRWSKEDLEKNFIAQIDSQEKMNHRVSKEDLPCGDCIVQTAVHIVKIGGIYHDGKNALVTTISSPLEGWIENMEEVSFLKAYRKVNGKWQSEVIDKLKVNGFRGLAVGDIYNKKKQVVLAGNNSKEEEEGGSLYAYEYENNAWKKTTVYYDQEDHQIKAIKTGDIYGDGKQRILLATGNSNAKIIILTWNGKTFDEEKVGQVSSLFDLPGNDFFSMTALLGKTGKNPTVIIAGQVSKINS